MTDDTTERVLSAARAWIWTPHDAVVRADDVARVVVSAGRADLHRAQPRPGHTTDALIDHVVALAADADPHAILMWPTYPDTEPADLVDRLVARGADLAEDLDIMAWPFDAPLRLDVPADATVRRVDDPARLPDAHLVAQRTFKTPAPSALFVAKESADLVHDVADDAHRSVFRYVAYDGDTPIGTAGLTLEPDGIAKLWGGSVVATHRGRGVYRALLAARLDEARSRGADLALIKARTGTSGPIVARAGFTVHGHERVQALPVTP